MGKLSLRGLVSFVGAVLLLSACFGSGNNAGTARPRFGDGSTTVTQRAESYLRSLVTDLKTVMDRLAGRSDAITTKTEMFVTAYGRTSVAILNSAHAVLAAELRSGLVDVGEIETMITLTSLQTRFGSSYGSLTSDQRTRLNRVTQISGDYARDMRRFLSALLTTIDSLKTARVAELGRPPTGAPVAPPTLPTIPAAPSSALPPVTAIPTATAPARGNVSGNVYAPNGTDPVQNALVYAPATGNEAAGGTAQSPRATPDLPCGEPTEAYLAKTCSRADGSFLLSGVPTGTIRILVSSGLFSIASTVAVLANRTAALPRADSTLPAVASARGRVPRIAVALGTYDHLENVLAKLGLGRIDARGALVPGSQNFAIYGRGHRSAPDLFRSSTQLAQHDMILINCGEDYYTLLREEGVLRNLRTFVENGGRLYVTDRAYEFVARAFPQYIEFAGTGNAFGRANRGTGGLRLNATVRSPALRTWLRDSGVRCGNETTPTNTAACLNADGTVPLSGFMGGWAMMDGIHPRHAEDVTTWIDGRTEPGAAIRPLTVTINHGRGKVLFSSYHTHHGSTGPAVFPQERVLQYFVFELAR